MDIKTLSSDELRHLASEIEEELAEREDELWDELINNVVYAIGKVLDKFPAAYLIALGDYISLENMMEKSDYQR